MSPVEREVNVKGMAFRQVLDTWEEVRGKAFREEALAAVAGPGGDAMRSGTLLWAAMHPVSQYRALLQAGADISGGGVAFTKEIGRRSAQRDIGSVHRLVFRLLSTEMLLKQVPRLLALYFDGGKGLVAATAPGLVRLQLRDFHGFDELVWMDFLGGCEAMLAATGARATRWRIVEGGQGSEMLVEFAFQKGT